MFHGSITALITPFRAGEIDWKAFDALVEWQTAEGSHGLVACGTTGEAPALSADEHRRIVERTVTLVKGRIPVIAGTGTSCTAKTIEMTASAREAGADAALVVTPYYNKPTQEGLFRHYEAVARAAGIPVILYNVPGRTCVDLGVETAIRLSGVPGIAGLKDATGDLARVRKIADAAGPDFCLLSGDDDTALAFLEQGGHGCISVVSNIAPGPCAAIQDEWAAGNAGKAREIDAKLKPLYKALFCEPSPQPVKYAAMKLGLCPDELRLPLIPAGDACRRTVDEAMALAGLAAPGPRDSAERAHG